MSRTNDWYWDGSSADLADIVRFRAVCEHTPTAEIQRRIADIRGQHADLDDEEVDRRMAKLLDQHLVLTKPLQILGVYRARKNKKPGEFFNNVFENLWYPKPIYAKRGRLNADGEPVFYCASARNIAGLEVSPQVGDWITLLAADKVDRRRPLEIIALGLERCEKSALDLVSYTPVRDDGRIRKTLGARSNYLKWCMVDDFLGELLSQIVLDGQEDRYKATVALAKRLQCFRVDGFMYPSIATQLQGINLCLTTAAADSHLHPLRCHVFRIDRKMDSPWGFAVSRIASSSSIGEDGTITWEHHDHGPADLASLSASDANWGQPEWRFV